MKTAGFTSAPKYFGVSFLLCSYTTAQHHFSGYTTAQHHFSGNPIIFNIQIFIFSDFVLYVKNSI